MADQRSRKLSRRHLIVYLRVYDRGSDALLGHLVDITCSGLMLMSEQEIPVDRVCRLRIDVGEGHGRRGYLDLDARSVWSRRDVNPSYVDTGFELIEPSEHARSSIENLILDLGFAD